MQKEYVENSLKTIRHRLVDIRDEIEYLEKELGESRELEICKKLLLQSNELLRSAYAIAQRDGEQTNWEAFRTQLQAALQAQHESGLTQRVPDVCPVCAGTGYKRISPTMLADCRECNGTGQRR